YETPVLGAPFSLPFELPLYQWLSARLSTLGGLPLETAGRLVSEAFFLLTAAALFAALGALGIPRPRRLAFVSILLVSPVYLFWSPTFMIESTALCLCMAWLALLLAHRFTSGALREWTLGKPWSRFDLSLWSVQLDRAIPDSIGSSVLLAAGAAAVIATRRRRGELAVCVLGYLAGPLVFANLHFV